MKTPEALARKAAYMREWRRKNPAKQAAMDKAYRANPENKAKLDQRRWKWKTANPERYAAYMQSVGRRFSALKSEAKRRGLVCSITREEYVAIAGDDAISVGCDYCGGPLPKTSGGLDRKDSSLGYELGNVVPCCEMCNVAKSDHFTYDEFRFEVGPAIRRIRTARLSVPEAQ